MEQMIESNTAIISIDASEPLLPALESISAAGFTTVECLHQDAQLLNQAICAFPSLRIGVGNILNVDALDSAQQAGAHFGSSFGFMPSLTQTSAVYHFDYFPGIATFSEAMQAIGMGCRYVRPFPADLNFCKALSQYLPMLKLFPSEPEKAEVAQSIRQLSSVAAVYFNYRNLALINARNYCF